MRMPGVRLTIATLFLTICFNGGSAPANPAQVPVGLNLAGQIGGSMLALDLTGEVALVGVGPRLLVVDVTSPQTPYPAGQSMMLPDVVRDIRIVGGIAYVAAGPGGLHMIDVRMAREPVYLGYLNTPGSAVAVSVSADVAYVALANAPLQVVDVSHPSLPRLVTTYPDQANATDVQVSDGRAYVVTANRLAILDVRTPGAPRQLGFYDYLGGLARVWISGTRAYLTASGEGLLIVDIADPRHPRLLGAVDTSGSAVDVRVAGDIAYLADTVGGVQLVNVHNPAWPVLLGTFQTAGSALRIRVAGDLAFTAVLRQGLVVIDVSDPAHPRAAGLFSPPADVSRVDAQGGTVYAAGDRRLTILDMAAPSAPRVLGSFYAGAAIMDLTTTRPDPGQPALTLAFLALGSDGLQIMDVSDPAAPIVAGTYQPGAALQRIVVSGTLAYLGTAGGLEIVNVRDPGIPSRIGALATGGSVTALRVSGGLAYLVTSLAFEIIDVSNAGAPMRVSSFTILYGARDLALVQDNAAVPATFAYLAAGWAWSGGSLLVLDVSRPQAPRLVNSRDTAGAAVSIALGGDLAFVTSLSCALSACQGRVIVYDIHDPAMPVEMSSYRAPSTVGQVRFTNGTLYLANRESGLLVLTPAALAVRRYMPGVWNR